MDGCRRTATSASPDAELPDWSRKRSLLHNPARKLKQNWAADPALGSRRRRWDRFHQARASGARISRTSAPFPARHIQRGNTTARDAKPVPETLRQSARQPFHPLNVQQGKPLAGRCWQETRATLRQMRRSRLKPSRIAHTPGHPTQSSNNRGKGGRTGTPNFWNCRASHAETRSSPPPRANGTTFDHVTALRIATAGKLAQTREHGKSS